MPGTDVAYLPTRCPRRYTVQSYLPTCAFSTNVAYRGSNPPALAACYGMSGTDIRGNVQPGHSCLPPGVPGTQRSRELPRLDSSDIGRSAANGPNDPAHAHEPLECHVSARLGSYGYLGDVRY
eukprot:2933009-Rhodomonas_salina.1